MALRSHFLSYLNKRITITEVGGFINTGILHYINSSTVELILDDGVSYTVSMASVLEIHDA